MYFSDIRIKYPLKARLHWSAFASASASVFFKYLAFHLLCLHWAASASASFIRVRVRFFSTVHRLYMASALTRYFVKDADAEAYKYERTRVNYHGVYIRWLSVTPANVFDWMKYQRWPWNPGVLTIFWVTGRLGPFDPPFSTYVEIWPLLLGSDVEYWPPFFQAL